MPPDAGGGVTAEASTDRVTWHPITVDGTGVGLFLVRGPQSSLTDGVLISSGCGVWVRITGDPEQVVRHAGSLTLE